MKGLIYNRIVNEDGNCWMDQKKRPNIWRKKPQAVALARGFEGSQSQWFSFSWWLGRTHLKPYDLNVHIKPLDDINLMGANWDLRSHSIVDN